MLTEAQIQDAINTSIGFAGRMADALETFESLVRDIDRYRDEVVNPMMEGVADDDEQRRLITDAVESSPEAQRLIEVSARVTPIMQEIL